MGKKKEGINWEKGFPAVLQVKGIAIGIILTVIIALAGLYCIALLPYYSYKYLNIGLAGLIIGGVGMFIFANLIMGIIAHLSKANMNDLIPVEFFITLLSFGIIALSWLYIAYPPV